ncbi:MAG TPA: hypothetical protein VFZ52_19835 [Chryseolinea sp.]
MKDITLDRSMTRLDEAILRTLLYFDIFNYPLKAEEVFKFLSSPAVDKSTVAERLNNLSDRKIVFRFNELFSVKNDPDLAQRRLNGNREAEKYLVLARKKAKLISRFPFVRAVLASGSLSKGYMDKNSDLDFFIITAPKRLWIARTLLVLYKRLFLANSHKYFCVNYFVDEKHLEIEEKNLFTATELATVIPLQGAKQYEDLQRVNSWLGEFFPNFRPQNVSNVPPVKLSRTRDAAERLMNFVFGDTLERYLQKKTLSRWKRIYEKNFSVSDFKIAFKSKAYASKNHPRNFQRAVIDLYAEKLRSFGLSANQGAGVPIIPLHEEVTMKSNAGV